MMSSESKVLKDDDARRDAISLHDRSILVEAGAGLCGSLMDEDLIDELVVYIAPLLLGDESAKPVAIGRVAETLSSGRRFALWRAKRVGDDMELTYRRQPPPVAMP